MPLFAHIGCGLYTKKYAPELPLWMLLVGSLFVDIIAAFMFTAPTWIHHGMIMAIFWSIVFGGISYFILSKKIKSPSRLKTLILVPILLSFTHWIFDFIGWPMTAIEFNEVGVPFFFADTPRYGLGVYRSWAGTLIMEIGVFSIGLYTYINNKNN